MNLGRNGRALPGPFSILGTHVESSAHAYLDGISHSFRCGSGLLTHILTAEGYEGYGIDLRARISWSHYPESTQERLRVQPSRYFRSQSRW
jgi:hypothetical protein